jgi:hypothetical protein
VLGGAALVRLGRGDVAELDDNRRVICPRSGRQKQSNSYSKNAQTHGAPQFADSRPLRRMVNGEEGLSSAPAEKGRAAAGRQAKLPARAMPKGATLLLPSVGDDVHNSEDAPGSPAILARETNAAAAEARPARHGGEHLKRAR